MASRRHDVTGGDALQPWTCIGSGAASALVTIAIIAGVVIVLAVAGVAALLVYRARSGRPGRAVAARPVYRLPPAGRSALEDSRNRAIGPAREVHLHLNVTPDQLAAIMRRIDQEE